MGAYTPLAGFKGLNSRKEERRRTREKEGRKRQQGGGRAYVFSPQYFSAPLFKTTFD